jgi:hypothetical protein
VTSARLPRILTAIAAEGPPRAGQLCTIAAQIVEVDGAGVMIEGADQRAPLCSSDDIADRVEDLSFTLGEGPGVDAHRDGMPVSEPHLARPRLPRWPSFAPLALTAGVAAVFSFPLRVGGVHMGALTLYNIRPGALTDDQHADALVMASVVTSVVLAHQAEAPLGELAAELEALNSSYSVVHRALGMVSVQLDLSVADALVRLRGHAYAEGRTLLDVADDVVRGELRFTRGPHRELGGEPSCSVL